MIEDHQGVLMIEGLQEEGDMEGIGLTTEVHQEIDMMTGDKDIMIEEVETLIDLGTRNTQEYDDRGPPGADGKGNLFTFLFIDIKMVDGDLSVAVITVTIDMEAETPAERPRLNLKPRTKAPEDAPTTDKPPARKPSANIFGDAKPVDIVAKEKEKERAAPMSDKPPARKPSANIFGDAKPVDTAAKEREIEERLRRGREDESRRKADEEKENTNSTSPGYRPRQYSGEEGGGRQRRLSSNSSGPPPVTSPGKPRRDSDVSNHSQEVFSGGEETKEEPRSPVSPAHRDEAASKLVPAPPHQLISGRREKKQ
ncbi:EIF4B [Mytilus edulis]|uniref:EIF4B n=1 Tax=Mytilus edulis TaxID=6550 RepID=A0A8S3Q1Y1_MYTED|nr:EIF4B [Mytilus edulis]